MATVQRFRGSDGKGYTITTNGYMSYLESNGHTLFTYDGKTDKTCRGHTCDSVGDGNLLMALLSQFL